MKADSILSVCLPVSIRRAIEAAAKKNLRSMSSMTVWALSQWLASNGFLDEPSRRAASRRLR
jgi:hypothetical protein